MSRFGKYVVSAVAAAAMLMATVAVAMTVTERVPDGTYCGNYASGLVVGNVTVKASAQSFDMNMKGLGLDLQCKDEKFLYDPKTHHAKVEGATDPNDCIGSVLTQNGLTLDVVYQPNDDILVLDLGFTKIPCKKCSAVLVA